MNSETDFEIPGYDLDRLIARGGMSEVYLAKRRTDRQPVVVKIALSTADHQTRERLIRERHLLEKVDNRHVVKSLDHGDVDGHPYLILEYIDGKSLRELIQPGRTLPWKKAVAILQQLSDALSSLHAQDVLHRDVKPENVLVDKDGQVKLIDLGIGAESVAVGALTTQSQFLGTVDYMAPEQRHRLLIDHRTDQYSLAAVTFEMLTGQCCLGQFRRPSELNPRLPCGIDQVLLKGLERDPDDRFPSIESFTNAVVAAGSERGRRKWIPAAAVCGAACLFVIASSVVGDPRPREPSAAGQNLGGASTAAPVGPEANRRFTDNSLGMRLVWISAGTFQMGATADEIQWQFKGQARHDILSETPQHRVTLTRPFWMGTHEVSVKQFRAFIEATQYQTTSERQLARQRQRHQPVWNAPARYPVADDLPVCAVSWEDARAFCEWLSQVEGATYRLPTEAEWEYACRAGSTQPWCCEPDQLADFAAHWRDWCAGPMPVGTKRPNAWGLHDMHGNVWEWCLDYFNPTFYEVSPEIDPLCSQPREAGEYHVLRSGGYFGSPRAIRSTRRQGQKNCGACTDLGHAIGFRVVREADASGANRSG